MVRTEWSFLTNHALILITISRNPRITALEIASKINITERAVRKIIKDLDDNNYLDKEKIGRRIKYHIYHNKSLRSDIHRKTLVGNLLDSLG